MATSPIDAVKAFLANPTDRDNVFKYVAPDATYISLTYDNPTLKKILPYAGVHTKAGPQAVLDVFQTVNRIWINEAFEVQALFGSGEDVAVFGSFTYRSRLLGNICKSPFNIWAKVKDVEGEPKIVFMQFMEDTIGSTGVFRLDYDKGYGTYRVDPDTGKDIEV